MKAFWRRHLPAPLSSTKCASYLLCLAMAAAHGCAVVTAASVVGRGPILHNQRGDPLLHGFLENLESAPPLARWDSIWYYGIADKGYIAEGGEARLTAGFAPLYGVLMRWVSAALGCGCFTAGTWISVLCSVAAAMLLAAHVRQRYGNNVPSWAAAATLLAFPSAYLLVAIYSEALFLASALAAFVLARRGQRVAGAAAAFAAGLTRVHGLALIPALALLGWEQWRAEGRRSTAPGCGDGFRGRGRLAAALLPACGAAAAYAALASYFWARWGDPLGYFAAKREGWQLSASAPWKTLDVAVEQLQRAVAHPELGTIYTVLELPCLYLAAAATAALFLRRWWPEATYVACTLAVPLFSGSLWGLPRYTLLMFPIFPLLGGLRRRPVALAVYLAVGLLLQACLLINFVQFRGPAP